MKMIRLLQKKVDKKPWSALGKPERGMLTQVAIKLLKQKAEGVL